MELKEAILNRHSVRSYLDRPIEKDTADKLSEIIDRCNEESGLHIQLVLNEPKAFDSAMAHYGNFKGVSNYIALIGRKGPDLDEKCGYYGEKVVLEAQRLGLNTCWVAMTYKRIPSAFKVDKGEKLTVVIALGYGATQGVQHRSKPITDVSNCTDDSPEWFRKGVEAALLAPTAVNQQKFFFFLAGESVEAKAGLAFYAKMDLGIAKYHFEIGSGRTDIWM
ncbi:MAG: nitroreductase [Oscillospiraceae bacterium]|nr:nitroreductase [Oscillospiraceae bacterium]